MSARFFERGWARFPVDQAVLDWLGFAGPAALEAALDPAYRETWLRCGGTWFAGVDVLPNDGAGRVAGSGRLGGAAWRFISGELGQGGLDLHRGQVSVVYPGYPRPNEGESEAAFRYRRDRDAAHLDGLLPIGPDRRRMLRERHAYILGLPVTEADPGAAPFVVWEGSHEVMRAGLAMAYVGKRPETWADVDVTEAYHQARRQVFQTCKRRELAVVPGEALLIHRLALHGIAPWAEGARADPAGRAIIYFRPEMDEVEPWITAP